MQCLHTKVLEGKDRFRIVLSDSKHFVQCILATQANHVMHDGQLQRGSIVRVRQCQAQSHKGKKCVFPQRVRVYCQGLG